MIAYARWRVGHISRVVSLLLTGAATGPQGRHVVPNMETTIIFPTGPDQRIWLINDQQAAAGSSVGHNSAAAATRKVSPGGFVTPVRPPTNLLCSCNFFFYFPPFFIGHSCPNSTLYSNQSCTRAANLKH